MGRPLSDADPESHVDQRSRDQPESLEDQLAQVALGSELAFESVYRRVSTPVYGLIRRVLRDEAQSQEVSQEVLLYVWREASRYDERRGSGLAWVMTIAHRRAVDRVRHERTRSERQRWAAARERQTPHDSVGEEVQDQLDKEAVRRCLATLTNTQRESILLAYYGGHTVREVAEQLDIPLGTAKTRIRDGLLRLRDGVSAA